ncbi:uncharacterized protein LOC116418348 [Nasonia vitripennis]|uniref:Uncharacterized protein n=1 Tax=Nasonia vitripennis TaxID=7425 RepID=A0A7M7QNM4_NASVI|nr:uncharacterized protein LOC116418348 [Nasonia vitripennis]
MSVDLKYQLKMMFDSVEIKKEIFDFINKMDNRNNDEIAIRDIYDSELYKKINSDTNMKYITYNLSTDGAPLTKSGKRGFWPLQIILNCLPPKSRFKYSLICGMLTCTEEPNSDLANLYFNNFKEQAALLYNEGISVTDLNEQKIIIKFCPLAIPVDSVCRPIVQNRIKFNGYFGCSWCYHRGEYIKDVSGIRYGLLEIDPEIRSHASHLKDIKIINSKNLNLTKIISERGVKGDITSITKLPHIDMVWSFSYDYMHGLLAGVEQQIFKKWTDSKSISNFKLTNQEIKVINQRLLSIQPTQDIHRQPRSLKEKGNWKSAEIKSWCLIYSLPCLQGILDDTALKHYSLLVKSLYVLLNNNITKEELDQCESDLLEFVGKYEIYYGIENMTFNIHTLLYVVDSVKKSGPLWSNSTFPFESNIFQLKQLLNGPNGMDKQMIRKHLQRLHFKTDTVDYSSDEIRNYCSNLYKYKTLSTHYGFWRR